VTLDAQSRQARRRRRRRFPWTIAIAVIVLVCVFAAGIALGEALHDNPKPGGTKTTSHTLRPLPLVPQTVTVTVHSTG
jgi:hypothetical protein